MRQEPESLTVPPLHPRSRALCPSHAYARSWSSPGAIPQAIHLEVGEPDFPTSEHVVDADPEAVWMGRARYAPNAGLPELRKALADKVARRSPGATATRHAPGYIE